MRTTPLVTRSPAVSRLLTAMCILGFLSLTGCPPPRDKTANWDPPPGAKTSADQTPSKLEVREINYDDGTLARRIEGYVESDGTFVYHGLMQDFWRGGVKKKGETMFVNGIRSGPRRAWYQTGQAWSQGNYIDGLEDGTWISWFPNGNKSNQYEFKLGAWHGTEIEWHLNGQKKRQVEYVKGKKQGSEPWWDEFGNLARTVDYVDGKPQP